MLACPRCGLPKGAAEVSGVKGGPQARRGSDRAATLEPGEAAPYPCAPLLHQGSGGAAASAWVEGHLRRLLARRPAKGGGEHKHFGLLTAETQVGIARDRWAS